MNTPPPASRAKLPVPPPVTTPQGSPAASSASRAADAATVAFTTRVEAVELALPSGLSLDGAPLKIGQALPDLT